jgi:hypothetical protein
MSQLYENVSVHAGKSDELSHSFFLKVKAMIDNGDGDALLKEKIPLKLLRLSSYAQEGFILTDFPNNT